MKGAVGYIERTTPFVASSPEVSQSNLRTSSMYLASRCSIVVCSCHCGSSKVFAALHQSCHVNPRWCQDWVAREGTIIHRVELNNEKNVSLCSNV